MQKAILKQKKSNLSFSTYFQAQVFMSSDSTKEVCYRILSFDTQPVVVYTKSI
jgi:hypothetical protein